MICLSPCFDKYTNLPTIWDKVVNRKIKIKIKRLNTNYEVHVIVPSQWQTQHENNTGADKNEKKIGAEIEVHVFVHA